MALFWGTNFDPVSRQTSQQPMEEVTVLKQQPRGAIQHETNVVSCVTSEWPIPRGTPYKGSYRLVACKDEKFTCSGI